MASILYKASDAAPKLLRIDWKPSQESPADGHAMGRPAGRLFGTGVILRFALALGLMGCGFLAAEPAEAPRPNVIVVFSDDQGYGDFSCHGNPILKTPGLDRLHDASVRFDNFHVAPVCTPSRGQLMTGLDALHNQASTVPAGRNLMRRDIPTLADVFAGSGYATGHFGKWHLGDTYPDRPIDRGFQKSVWHKGWGLPSEIEYDNDYYHTRYYEEGETKFSDRYCTNLWFDKAIEWMAERQGTKRQFFVYLALNAPHGPYYSLPEDEALYADKVESKKTAAFFGMIACIDRNVERLNRWLEEQKLKENTLLVYMNDNGGTAGVKVFNAGMRGNKGDNYDGGHRAACFMDWPGGGFGSPRTVRDAAQIQDLLPTFVDLCRLETKARFDGVSLEPVLRGRGKLQDRMLVVQYGGRIRPSKYYSCVVWNDWRLVGERELYNILEDPGQRQNVAGANPKIYQKMKSHYENWWRGVEPTIDDVVRLVVGDENENPKIVTCNNWLEVDVDNASRVARATGPKRGGKVLVETRVAGKYRVELSRWPFHLGRPLTGPGPSTTIGARPLKPGKALPIASGSLSLDGNAPLKMKAKPEATSIAVEIHLSEGQHDLQGWFTDPAGEDLAGAYYMRIERL